MATSLCPFDVFAGQMQAGNARSVTQGSDLWTRYWMGSAYYPESYPREQWSKDFAKMRELGLNMVRMAEFAWSSIEPSPGKFEFEWLDRAIELANEAGIYVVLATPTAALPPWLYKLHPDVLGANENGPYTYGGRKGFAIYSPAMQEAADRIITELAKHYGSNKAVVGWQLSNEPGYPLVSYDHDLLVAWRIWLKARYGTIAKLNSAWSGKVWSNDFDDWDEIIFPINSPEGGWNPGLYLDYRRFFSASFLHWLKFEADTLRHYTKGQFLYTNWPNTRWSVDTYEAATFLDIAAWDNYGHLAGDGDYHSVLHSGLDDDLCRSSHESQRFFASEKGAQAPPYTDARAVRLSVYMDLAHGSSGTLFWEWRPSAIGSEMGYVSITEPDGSFGASADQLRKMEPELARIGPLLAGAQTNSDVALIYSYDNQWDQGFWGITTSRSLGAGYDEIAERYYTGAKSLKRNIDVVSDRADLRKYKLVIAPGLRIVSEASADLLKQFVNEGGILVLDQAAGTRDPDGRMRRLIEPGLFADLAGVRVRAADAMRISSHDYAIVFQPGGQKFTVSDALERVQPNGAEVLARYAGLGMEGDPAITLNAYGKGHVVYVGAECRDAAFFDFLFSALGSRFGISRIMDAPDGVEVVMRQKGDRTFVFLLNYNRDPVVLKLPAPCMELISNKRTGEELRIEGLDLAILDSNGA